MSDAPAAVTTTSWREVFRGKRGRLTAGLLLLEALVAVQALVVATILPEVRRELGMVHLYGLTFTAASLATIASIPVAGRATDRYGAPPVLAPSLACFTAGLAVSALAPSMPVVIAGQFLAGAGGGGLYALSIGTIAKTYPDSLRARVMALLATMWIVPGLVGPALGAFLAETVGWRWAFAAPLPIVTLAWVLIVPALDVIPRGPGSRVAPFALRWPLLLMAGAGAVFTGLAFVEPLALVPVTGGLVVSYLALRRIVPSGTFRAAPGIPAAGAAAFLVSCTFLAMDGFLTLMLTEVRGLTIGVAGLVVTVAAFTWAAGSLWQSGRTDRLSLPDIVRWGTVVVLIGGAAVASVLITSVPVVVAYVGWGVVGFGMGTVFPTVPLAVMRVAPVGEESSELSSVLLLDMLGVATGAGLGGASVAISEATGASLKSGIAGSFVIALVSGIALVAIAGRIPDRPPRTAADPRAAS